ncbi:hypothetical protein KKF97_17760 [Myxococcota bacterium]|nr:hypothetical protein [Myxococcota bacterium]MBU1381006.1 hypothetical protein [Myxococcota bacterium]MBU1502648.1 hypothetical protein [bacterium]
MLKLLILFVILMTGCFGSESQNNNNNNTDTTSFWFNVSTFNYIKSRDLDILFQIDTSGSMREAQTRLRSRFSELITVLKRFPGGLPNIHIGVSTTDIGTYNYNVGGCEGVGDDGMLLKGACANPVGQNFIVDVEAAGCNIERDADSGNCSNHKCAQENCDVSAFTVNGVEKEPAGLMFAEDDDGCPRCRNYSGEDINSVFDCISDVGTSGCGFEQHFESLLRALVPHNTKNPEFIRHDAFLAILFVTDEDDCSAKQPGNIFDDSDTSISGNLGPLSSFRCTEFGIVCDEPWERGMSESSMTHTNCHSRPAADPDNYLWPVSTYINFLTTIKPLDHTVVGALAGPDNGILRVSLDENSWPYLQNVCSPPDSSIYAVSGIRLSEFVNYFNSNGTNWAFNSICDNDYTPALQRFGFEIKNKMIEGCPDFPLEGCPDPPAAFGMQGITSLSQELSESCNPVCNVKIIEPDGQSRSIGQCPEDYKDGHPDKRDPNLPVEACWHVVWAPECSNEIINYGPSRGAAIRVSIRSTPPLLGSIIEASCLGFQNTETICNDTIDNDYDGLVDSKDPDCYGK